MNFYMYFGQSGVKDLLLLVPILFIGVLLMGMRFYKVGIAVAVLAVAIYGLLRSSRLLVSKAPPLATEHTRSLHEASERMFALTVALLLATGVLAGIGAGLLLLTFGSSKPLGLMLVGLVPTLLVSVGMAWMAYDTFKAATQSVPRYPDTLPYWLGLTMEVSTGMTFL